MAGSRLGRMFGRRSGSPGPEIPDPRAGTAPYGPPVPYGPPAPYGPVEPVPFGHGPYGPGPAAPPIVARGRLAEAERRRRHADQQVGVLVRFEAKLSEQVRRATEAERDDYAREVISRRLAVRARLEEATYLRGVLRLEEERLTAELARAEGRAVQPSS